MKITKENAKAAIERFNCVVLQDYPKIENLCAVESETKTSVELYAYSRDALDLYCKWEGALILGDK